MGLEQRRNGFGASVGTLSLGGLVVLAGLVAGGCLSLEGEGPASPEGPRAGKKTKPFEGQVADEAPPAPKGETPSQTPPQSPPDQDQKPVVSPLEFEIRPEEGGRPVPSSFVGLSQEWWLGPIDSKAMMTLYQRLSSHRTGPLFLRIGGGTADHLDTVPVPAVWSRFAKLHNELGMRFIFNLNLLKKDKTLIRAQKDAALAALPPEAIVSFEIGNEPNYFPSRNQRPKNYLNEYPAEFREMALGLDCHQKRDCAGPAWGHIFMKDTTLDWFLKTNGSLLNLTTVHFYKANNETPNTPETLLEEGALRKAMESLSAQTAVAKKHGIPLRVDESNPISGGGLDGVSNVFAGALWTIDTALEVMATGAVGVDFHQGSPLYAFYKEVKDDKGERALWVQPSFYALLFVQSLLEGAQDGKLSLATAHPVVTKEPSPTPGVKVWPVVGERVARIAILNKGAQKPAVVTVTLEGASWGSGRLSRLVASGLDARTGITWGGTGYDGPNAPPSGHVEDETVPPEAGPAGTRYTLRVPPASALVLEVKR